MTSVTLPDAAQTYDAYVLKNYARSPLTVVRGEGSRVWDDQGNRYLDFTSGIGVNALGHCHPKWVEAVSRQARQLVHTSNLFRNPVQADLARKLVELAGPGRVFFCNSGAEANEALLKLARLHGRRKAGDEGVCFKVICASQAFHGRTFGGMSATPQEKVQKGFRPLTPGFVFGEFNNLQSFADLVDEQTAAIFVETIQGEGGIHVASSEFLAGLRELCDRHDLLLMLDEVQCGIGRTGRFFAFEDAGVTPDAIGMAKGLGGGFPIGAMWTGERATDLFQPGSHGTTFGGNPLACAAALAVLETIEGEGLLTRVSRAAPPWIEAIRGLALTHPGKLSEVRGRGFMVGLQLTEDPARYIGALRSRGLLVPSAAGNVVRLLPPLNVSDEDLRASVDILSAAFSDLA